MPKIQWEQLPKEKWAHLHDRAKEREISMEDLFARRHQRGSSASRPAECQKCGARIYVAEDLSTGSLRQFNIVLDIMKA